MPAAPIATRVEDLFETTKRDGIVGERRTTASIPSSSFFMLNYTIFCRVESATIVWSEAFSPSSLSLSLSFLPLISCVFLM